MSDLGFIGFKGLLGGLKRGLKEGLRGLKAGLKGGLQGMNFIFFVFNPLKRLRVAFSFLWGGEHGNVVWSRVHPGSAEGGAMSGC